MVNTTVRLKTFTGIGLFILSSHILSAQIADTFMVTLVTKTSEHPFFGLGYDMGFAVDGVEGKTLILERKKTYRFQYEKEPYNTYQPTFNIRAIGGGPGTFERKVEYNNLHYWVQTTPDSLYPDTLYYSSVDEPYMGGMILIVDSITASITEGRSMREAIANHRITPNPFAHSASLTFNLPSPSHIDFKVIDLLGRVVRQENLGQLEAGTHNLPLNGKDIPVGLYYYTIETETVGRREIVSGKLQILR